MTAYIDYLLSQGYTHVRKLPDGTYAGLVRLMFTTGLCVGLDNLGWKRRYCYDNRTLAIGALKDIQGIQDVPEGWIASRPETDDEIARKSRPPNGENAHI